MNQFQKPFLVRSLIRFRKACRRRWTWFVAAVPERVLLGDVLGLPQDDDLRYLLLFDLSVRICKTENS